MTNRDTPINGFGDAENPEIDRISGYDDERELEEVQAEVLERQDQLTAIDRNIEIIEGLRDSENVQEYWDEYNGSIYLGESDNDIALRLLRVIEERELDFSDIGKIVGEYVDMLENLELPDISGLLSRNQGKIDVDSIVKRVISMSDARIWRIRDMIDYVDYMDDTGELKSAYMKYVIPELNYPEIEQDKIDEIYRLSCGDIDVYDNLISDYLFMRFGEGYPFDSTRDNLIGYLDATLPTENKLSEESKQQLSKLLDDQGEPQMTEEEIRKLVASIVELSDCYAGYVINNAGAVYND